MLFFRKSSVCRFMTKNHFPFDQRTRGQKRKRTSIYEEDKIEVSFPFLTPHSFKTVYLPHLPLIFKERYEDSLCMFTQQSQPSPLTSFIQTHTAVASNSLRFHRNHHRGSADRGIRLCRKSPKPMTHGPSAPPARARATMKT